MLREQSLIIFVFNYVHSLEILNIILYSLEYRLVNYFILFFLYINIFVTVINKKKTKGILILQLFLLSILLYSNK